MLTEKFLTKTDRESWEKIRNELKEEHQIGEITDETYEELMNDWLLEFRLRAYLPILSPAAGIVIGLGLALLITFWLTK